MGICFIFPTAFSKSKYSGGYILEFVPDTKKNPCRFLWKDPSIINFWVSSIMDLKSVRDDGLDHASVRVCLFFSIFLWAFVKAIPCALAGWSGHIQSLCFMRFACWSWGCFLVVIGGWTSFWISLCTTCFFIHWTWENNLNLIRGWFLITNHSVRCLQICSCSITSTSTCWSSLYYMID